ncbi:hypothetical protein CDAR_213131 [Caerostris darwini]|uniref:GDP-D-glucose phosphorylase 1 n=1 Tax=Caerostris darwini TaxID=1538125 RepID=A0AAV4PVZ6_9ARAC|nr:hypothetical protein CDAR_213131 [Caerostris darwini]
MIEDREPFEHTIIFDCGSYTFCSLQTLGETQTPKLISSTPNTPRPQRFIGPTRDEFWMHIIYLGAGRGEKSAKIHWRKLPHSYRINFFITLIPKEKMDEHTMQFSYSEDDFNFCSKTGSNSMILKTEWKNKMANACFRYELGDLRTKILPGNFNFIVQLNVKRAIERRKPQLISDIVMPFDNEKFHFGKVKEKEIIFIIQPQHWFESKPENTKEDFKHILLINVSPLEFGHSLLVPHVDKCSPQVLNFEALRLAVEIMLISSDNFLRLGFNSLGAFASVNHLHFHAYYLKYKMYLESAPVIHLKGRCYILTSFPSEGFVFELLKKEDIVDVVSSVMVLIDFLVEEKIPHNVFLTRGKRFTTSEENWEICPLRVYVWAREAYFGTKNDHSFNVAVCELAGHIPIKDENSYECITEEDISLCLKNACHNTFVSIKNDVKKLYE